MKVFELHFNPKKKGDKIFDSFIYEPESPEEKPLGSLYMAGELTKILPQNANFLNNLSSNIKNNYYQKANFQEGLKEANNFLDKETKGGNVGWLGNLNFAVLSFNNSILNFTKVGNIKILLLRGEEVLDISQDLELQNAEPYPLKVFSNIASGKISPEDKILVLTEEVFSALSQNEGILGQLSEVKNERELKTIFKINGQILSNVSGICLLITAGENISSSRLIRLPKKTALFFALILLFCICYFMFGGEKKKELQGVQNELREARSKIIMAESFLILKNNEKARALFQEAWDILSPLAEPGSSSSKEAADLQKSIENYLKK